MASTRVSKILLLTAVLSLAGVAYYFLATQDGDATVQSGPVGVGGNPPGKNANAAASGVFALPGGGGVSRASSLPLPGNSVAHRAMDDYLRASSIKAFIERYLPAALGGDGEAALAISKALDDCRFTTYRDPPDWTVHGDFTNPELALRKKTYENRLARCANVKDIPGIYDMYGRLISIAAASNSPVAVAWTLALAEITGNKGEAEQRAAQLLPLTDGDAVLGLSNYVSNHREGFLLGETPQPVGIGMYGAAWTLAACQLGMDCSASSRFLETTCIYEGRCGANSYQEMLEQSLPPELLARAEHLSDDIVAALRQGNTRYFGIASPGHK